MAYISTVPSECIVKIYAAVAQNINIFDRKQPLLQINLQGEGQEHANCYVIYGFRKNVIVFNGTGHRYAQSHPNRGLK